MTRFLDPCRGGGRDRPGRRHRGDGGLYPPDPVRRRSRDHPPEPQASDARPHDAGPDLRPDDRHGLRRQADLLLGRQSRASARCTGCATRSRTAGRSRSRSRSIPTPPWPTPTRPGAAGLPLRDASAAIIGADLPKVNPNIRSDHLSLHRRGAGRGAGDPPRCRDHPCARRPTAAGNVLIEGIVGVQKEAVLAAKRSIVTVEEIVDDFGPRSHRTRCVLPGWTIGAIAAVPGGAHPVLRARLLRARQRLLQAPGTRSRATATASWPGWRTNVLDAAARRTFGPVRTSPAWRRSMEHDVRSLHARPR